MKNRLTTLCCFILSVLLVNSCASPNFVFYHSEASIPQFAKFKSSEFFLIPKINEKLPFGVIAAVDKNKVGDIVDYYVLLSPPRALSGSITGSVEDYIHRFHVVLRTDKVVELIENIDNSIKLFKVIWNERKGISIEYSVAKEQNITSISKNVESWESDFRFIYKGFKRRNEAFVNLGVLQSSQSSVTYSYYLEKVEIIELKARIVSALDELKKLGLK